LGNGAYTFLKTFFFLYNTVFLKNVLIFQKSFLYGLIKFARSHENMHTSHIRQMPHTLERRGKQQNKVGRICGGHVFFPKALKRQEGGFI
jgi:hypothetical protein